MFQKSNSAMPVRDVGRTWRARSISRNDLQPHKKGKPSGAGGERVVIGAFCSISASGARAATSAAALGSVLHIPPTSHLSVPEGSKRKLVVYRDPSHSEAVELLANPESTCYNSQPIAASGIYPMRPNRCLTKEMAMR